MPADAHTRRSFLVNGSLALAAGTAAAGPAVTAATFAEAEKLERVTLSPAEQA